jgi:hypothetical protein
VGKRLWLLLLKQTVHRIRTGVSFASCILPVVFLGSSYSVKKNSLNQLISNPAVLKAA